MKDGKEEKNLSLVQIPEQKDTGSTIPRNRVRLAYISRGVEGDYGEYD